ncbi:MAG: DUF1326 domain-containing protein, partial [Streptosporangiaceae bacterium]
MRSCQVRRPSSMSPGLDMAFASRGGLDGRYRAREPCRGTSCAMGEGLMAWRLDGTYFESCSCDAVCPCTWSALTAKATLDRCRALLAYHVE